jgi:hypothetical protein
MGLALFGLELLQMARMWPSHPLNSIWAEDGYVWLSDSLRWSFLHALSTPYSGYLNTLARLVAAPVAPLPLSWFAPAMTISGTVIVAVSALVVWEASAGLIPHPVLRGTLVLMVVLLPGLSVDSLANVTYSIWFLTFASFWILFWRPATRAGVVFASAVLALSALSNGEMLLLIPVWLLRLFAVRTTRDWTIVGGYAVGTGLQLAASWGSTSIIGERGGGFLPTHGQWHWSLIPAYFQRVVGEALTGQRITGWLWVHVGTAFVILLVIALAALIVGAIIGPDPRIRAFVPVAVITSMLMFFFAGYQRQIGVDFYWPHGTYEAGAEYHYMIVPTLLILSAVLAFLDSVLARSPAKWRMSFRIGAISFILFAAVLTFTIGNSAIRGGYTWTAELAASRVACVQHRLAVVDVPIAPDVFGTGMQMACTTVLERRRLPYTAVSDLSVELAAPRGGGSISGVSTLIAITHDSASQSKVGFEISGGSLLRHWIGSAEFTQDGWALPWDSARLRNGTYAIQAMATDTLGNSAHSPVVFVHVDNRARADGGGRGRSSTESPTPATSGRPRAEPPTRPRTAASLPRVEVAGFGRCQAAVDRSKSTALC